MELDIEPADYWSFNSEWMTLAPNCMVPKIMGKSLYRVVGAYPAVYCYKARKNWNGVVMKISHRGEPWIFVINHGVAPQDSQWFADTLRGLGVEFDTPEDEAERLEALAVLDSLYASR